MAPNRDHLHIIDSRTHREYDIPIDDHFIHGSDISAIKSPAKHGEGPERSLGVFDRGLQHIACMESAITHIDGYRGRIEYRGHAIEKLFHENDYDEVLHLLLFGHLPSPQQKKALRSKLAGYLFPPQVVLDVLSQFPRDADPLALVTAGLSAYASADPVAIAARHDPRPQFHGNQAATDDAALRTMAYITATFASIYCHRHGKPLGRPLPDQSLIGNLLLMMGFEVSPTEGSRMLNCMERLWIIYADHEMTNSTAASLCVGSTLTDPISCFMTAVIAGAGPLHAGALELAYSVLNTIGTPENVSQYIEAVKAKQVRLFGYGHRVYKTADPRVSLINELIRDHEHIVSQNPLLRVALAVDEIANTDPYFVERHLKVNADLFGCFLYTAFGFESDLLPGFMMISRAAGVLAHWREAMGQPIKIWRPKQKYKSENIEASAKL